MNDERKIHFIPGICPYCGARLDYTEEERFVSCPVCEHTFPAEALGAPDLARANTAEKAAALAPVQVGSPKDALAYFDCFCKEYDWNNAAVIAALPSLALPELDRLADACKLAFPTDPDTYVLEYKVITAVFAHLPALLDQLEAEMVARYHAEDLSSVYDLFDEYRAVVAHLCSEREGIRTAAKRAIGFAEENGAKNSTLYDLRYDFYEVWNTLAPLTEVDELPDIAPLRAAEEARDRKIADRLAAEQGIDAEALYQEALQDEEDGLPLSLVLRNLMKIRGYKDTEKRIARMTSFFYFGNRYFEVAGRKYYTRQETGYNGVPTFSLYEIKDGIPSRRPALTGVTRVVATYANYIFFLRDDRYLCLFDAQSVGQKVAVLDAGRPGDYICAEGQEVFLSSDQKTFYLRKKLPIAWKKTGCLAWFLQLFKRKNKGVRNKFNNYSLLAVNMEDLTCDTVLDEVIDVMDFCDDNIFYTTMPKMFQYEVEFRVRNLKDGSDRQLLSSDCVIHKVTDSVIVFSLCAPNPQNLNLYAMDVASGETTLLERNVHGFYMLEGDRVFYTVSGGGEYHLLSVKLDGTCRREVLSEARDIVKTHGGYIYYVKGEGRNAALLKVDLNGENKTLLACRFASIIRIGSGYVYYFTVDHEIHSVLCNGKEDKTIARNVFPADIVAGRKHIFFYREDDTAGNDNCLSLFRLTPSTGVIRKIGYNVRGFKEFDSDTIFFSRAEVRLFETPVIDPRDEKFYKEEFLEKKTVSFEVIKYYKYKRSTGEVEEVLTLGIPENTGAKILPISGWYLRNDKTARGSVYTEARDALSDAEKKKADRRSALREERRIEKYERRKARADRRASRKKKRAIRKGQYPALPRYSRYTATLPVSNLANRSDFGGATRHDDMDGKL